MVSSYHAYVAAALAIAVAGAVSVYPADAAAQEKKGRIVCWKDKSGKVVGCGDKVPPEFQDSATREMDTRGVTRGTTESAEDAAKRRAQEQEAALVDHLASMLAGAPSSHVGQALHGGAGTLGLPAAIAAGDLNGDGQFTAVDLILFLNCAILSAGNCPPAQLDLNCDGLVTVSDAVILMNRIFLGIPHPCP